MKVETKHIEGLKELKERIIHSEPYCVPFVEGLLNRMKADLEPHEYKVGDRVRIPKGSQNAFFPTGYTPIIDEIDIGCNEDLPYRCDNIWLGIDDIEPIPKEYDLPPRSGVSGVEDTRLTVEGEEERQLFHGGCLGCKHRSNKTTEHCMGCKYFDANWSKPNLFESTEDIVSDAMGHSSKDRGIKVGDCDMTSEPVEKPPLGLQPKAIWNDTRRTDILEAIARYIAADKEVPKEWVIEFKQIDES